MIIMQTVTYIADWQLKHQCCVGVCDILATKIALLCSRAEWQLLVTG
jgi:hypothetical protein